MENKDKQYLVRSAWIQTIGMVVKMLAPALVIATARFFPQAVYGAYVSLQLLVLTLSRVTSFGMDRSLVALVSEAGGAGSESAAKGIQAASWLAFVLSWIPAFVLWVSGGDLPSILVMAGLVPWTLLLLWTGALEGARKPEYRVLFIHVIAFLLAPLLGVLFLWMGMVNTCLPWGFFIGNWISLFLSVWFLKKFFPHIALFPITFPTWHFLRYSLPVALSELVAPLIQRVDLWMILALLGPEKAAVYAVMTTLANGLRSVRQGYDNVILTLAASAKNQENKSSFEQAYVSTTRWVSFLQSLIAIVVLLFPSFLLGLAGKNYVVEPAALGLMVSGHLVYGYFGLSGQVLLGMGLSKWQFYQSLLALGLSAVLNLYWIPLYGLRGAAMASLTVLSLQALMQWFVARHLLGLKLMGTKLIPVGILCFALVIYSIYK